MFNVYPLNREYKQEVVRQIYCTRLIAIMLLLSFFIVSIIDFLGGNLLHSSKFRLLFFGDYVTRDRFSFQETPSFIFDVRNCNIKLSENSYGAYYISMHVSADSSTIRESSIDNKSVRTVKIHSKDVKPRCYVELKIPSNIQLEDITFQLSGNMTGLVLSDDRDGQLWQDQLILNSLNIEINNSKQNVFLTQPHSITRLKISGSYCNCNFEGLEIKNFTFDVKTGLLAFAQSSAITVNKVILNHFHLSYSIF